MRLSKLRHLYNEPPKPTPPQEKETPPPPTEKADIAAISESTKTAFATFIKRIDNTVQTGPAKASDIYGDLIDQAKNVIHAFSQNPPQSPDLEGICDTLMQVIESINRKPCQILGYTLRSTPKDFLPSHLANVAILSIALSHEFGWKPEDQLAVGVGALLHDLGMLDHSTFLNPHPLTTEEKAHLRELPKERVDQVQLFIDKLSPDSKTIISNVIHQFRERINGRGQPAGLKGSQISRPAQVVGLCETYEALTHARPHKKPLLPHDALRQILELSGESFDGIVVKALWETLSLFPPGSFVKLNNGEIARIVEIHREFPTKPVVKIEISGQGKKLDDDIKIDLSKSPEVAIEKAVDPAKIDLPDKRYSLELKMSRWWLK